MFRGIPYSKNTEELILQMIMLIKYRNEPNNVIEKLIEQMDNKKKEMYEKV